MNDPKCTSYLYWPNPFFICIFYKENQSKVNSPYFGGVFYLYYCNEKPMTESVFFGDTKECKIACGNKKWCKSFEYCHRDPKNTFCHLKSINRKDFNKPSVSFYEQEHKTKYEKELMGFSDYYENQINSPIKSLSIDKPYLFVGE